MEKATGYLEMMSWWSRKTLTEKAQIIGEDTLDKWVEQVIADEFIEYPAPIPASSVINRYQTVI
jgi:hypothetical protein